MIEPGTHKARASEWVLGRTSNGNEQIAVKFQLADGRSIVWYAYFTDKTAARTLESLRYCGWDGKDFEDFFGLDHNEVEIVVVLETDEVTGRKRARVRWVNRPGSGLKETLTGDDRAAFVKRIKALTDAQQSAAENDNTLDEDDTAFPFGANIKRGRAH